MKADGGDPLRIRRWIAMVSIAVFSVALLQVPLCNYLGYEFSAAIALLLPWIVGPLVISIERRSDRPPSYLSALVRGIKAALTVALVPLILGALNGIVVRNCSMPEGILYYFLIPGITAVFTATLGIMCAAVFRRPMIWYSLIVIAILAYGLVVGYVTPQIYSYNIIYGFFPGFSYDEILRITPALVGFRVLSLLTAALNAAIGEYCWLQRWAGRAGERRSLLAQAVRWRGYPLVAVLALILALSWWFRDRLGFETSDAYLRSVLNGEVTTPHFHIHYARGSFTPEELNIIANEHEFRYSQVARILRVQDRRPLSSFIYPDPETQYRLIGTKNTNISKPWRREIHLSKAAWEQTLKHELVHALAGEFGMPVIRAHYNIGLVEGLATAVDGEFGNRTLHEYAASVLNFDIVRHPERLLRPVGFAFQASAVSYVLMGSFCEYLIDRYGISSFKNLYGGRTPERVYGRSYAELIAEWEEYLSGYEIPREWKAHVDFYFRRPSIFAKLCARKTANLNEEGYNALERKDPSAAKEFFLRSYHLSRNSDAYAGVLRSEFAAARYDSVVLLFEAQDSLLRRSTQSLAILYGDALWVAGRNSAAAGVYTQLLDLDLSARLDEIAELRIAALREKAVTDELRPVLVGVSPDSVKLHLLDSLSRIAPHPLINYLRGKSLLRLKRYGEAVHAIAAINLSDFDPDLAGTAELMAGDAEFFLRHYQTAVMHYWNSLNSGDGAAVQNHVDDLIDRCLWYEENGKTYASAVEP